MRAAVLEIGVVSFFFSQQTFCSLIFQFSGIGLAVSRSSAMLNSAGWPSWKFNLYIKSKWSIYHIQCLQQKCVNKIAFDHDEADQFELRDCCRIRGELHYAESSSVIVNHWSKQVLQQKFGPSLVGQVYLDGKGSCRLTKHRLLKRTRT